MSTFTDPLFFSFSQQILSRETLYSPEASAPLTAPTANPLPVTATAFNAAAAPKASRIPDIRGTTRLSPQKELPPYRDSPVAAGPPDRLNEGRRGLELPFPRSKSSLGDGVGEIFRFFHINQKCKYFFRIRIRVTDLNSDLDPPWILLWP